MNMYTRRECISIGICFVRSSVPIHIYIFLSSRGISRIEGKNKKGVHESNIYGARAGRGERSVSVSRTVCRVEVEVLVVLSLYTGHECD